jgi:UDP-N-acetylmuramate-alanine ligase
VYLDNDRQRILDYLTEITRRGDLVLTLGAGDVGALGGELITRLGVQEGSTKRRSTC